VSFVYSSENACNMCSSVATWTCNIYCASLWSSRTQNS
jgi:hypothetical protein